MLLLTPLNLEAKKPFQIHPLVFHLRSLRNKHSKGKEVKRPITRGVNVDGCERSTHHGKKEERTLLLPTFSPPPERPSFYVIRVLILLLFPPHTTFQSKEKGAPTPPPPPSLTFLQPRLLVWSLTIRRFFRRIFLHRLWGSTIYCTYCGEGSARKKYC